MADKRLWILVANASRARLFATDAKAEKWDLIEQFQHDESRAKPVDLFNQADNPNAGTLHGPVPENDPNGRRELEHERFARELCAHLDRGVDSQAFDELVIAAPPAFLGKVRGLLSTRVKQRVRLDLDSDYSNLPARELPDRVPLL
ncbi:host attachment protein [Corallococcus sp. ZKHCc1 1396]|uniref:Host attachment protein n=1 Tax=Corallococcus soli TaxID=2710757 RepID=A0ABR9PGY9_9BACT|nr:MULTISPECIES: host attachment protein [Corallococcus]MBE4747177.1 host attachment protein [Corallococcus soli]MCY1036552.1 host attachment protein [Corallococcus sp. BB11-1]RYZ45190.1 MAG: host attachment protein [Myxococcaceae bacterium]